MKHIQWRKLLFIYCWFLVRLSASLCERLTKNTEWGNADCIRLYTEYFNQDHRSRLELTSVTSRHTFAQVKANKCIIIDDQQPMFVNLNNKIGRQLKRGKSSMTQAEDNIGELMSVQFINIIYRNSTHQAGNHYI